jgi:hypothetical protein
MCRQQNVFKSVFHTCGNEMLGVSIGSDCTIFAFIFMPTLPWTSLESSFKPQVAHQFVIKMALQKGTTQWDKVAYSPIHQVW